LITRERREHILVFVKMFRAALMSRSSRIPHDRHLNKGLAPRPSLISPHHKHVFDVNSSSQSIRRPHACAILYRRSVLNLKCDCSSITLAVELGMWHCRRTLRSRRRSRFHRQMDCTFEVGMSSAWAAAVAGGGGASGGCLVLLLF
jgi:hypothetical protein